MKTETLTALMGAHLDSIALYSASVSLNFENEANVTFLISTACDILGRDGTVEEYPLSSAAFSRLVGVIGGTVGYIEFNERGDFELQIGDELFTIRNDDSPSGIFRLTTHNRGIQTDEFF